MDVTVIKKCIFIWLDSVLLRFPRYSALSVEGEHDFSNKKKSKQLSHRTKLMIYSMKFVQ